MNTVVIACVAAFSVSFQASGSHVRDRTDVTKKLVPNFLLSPHAFVRHPLGYRFLPLRRKRLLRSRNANCLFGRVASFVTEDNSCSQNFACLIDVCILPHGNATINLIYQFFSGFEI